MSEASTTQSTRASHAPEGLLSTLQQRAQVIGAIGVVTSIFGVLTAPDQFFRSYLVGYVFWFGIGMGCLGLALLNYLTGGAWGFVVRRFLEAAARTLPVFAVLFIPVFFGMDTLYSWLNEEFVAANVLVQAKAAYLNQPFFLARTAVYFLVLGAFAIVASRWAKRQDQEHDPLLERKLQGLGAAGVLLYILLGTFIAFDWMMSTDPLWFSSIYGFYFVITHVLSGLCFVVVFLRGFLGAEPMQTLVTGRHSNDWGKLIFAFNMLWVYVSFSQFLIIWSGNLTEEIGWYITRRANGYWEWSVVMFALHFFVPFLLLLSRTLRRNPRILSIVAILLLVATWMDLYWNIMPSLQDKLALHWLDLAIPIGIGGLWVAEFVRQLRKTPLIPIHHPDLEKVLGEAHG